jgi:hypothetical protein
MATGRGPRDDVFVSRRAYHFMFALLPYQRHLPPFLLRHTSWNRVYSSSVCQARLRGVTAKPRQVDTSTPPFTATTR